MSVAPHELLPDDLNRFDRIGIQYQGGVSRAQALERRAVLNGTAVARFAPQPPPPGAGKRWDPEAFRVRNEYLVERANLNRTFTAQAISRDWALIEQKLRRCVTAVEAVEVLGEMEAFLLTDPFVTLIDVDAALKCLRALKLPFERLVRNVWSPGAEVQYDAGKLTIAGLLEAERADRSARAALPGSTARFGPASEVDTLVRNLRKQHATREAISSAMREAAKPKFAGMAVDREKPTSAQAYQRELLRTFRAQ
jgi:hypothetical protein